MNKNQELAAPIQNRYKACFEKSEAKQESNACNGSNWKKDVYSWQENELACYLLFAHIDIHQLCYTVTFSYIYIYLFEMYIYYICNMGRNMGVTLSRGVTVAA